VVVLRYLHDLPEKDVATELGVPLGTVKSSAARGLAALRLALEGQQEERSPR
jgi:DNA-directed RNA polymerase specialized sigma24 family protein